MDKKITIDFNADGSVTMEGHNFKGVECDKAMKAFEDALGVTTKRVNKPDYNQRQAQATRQVQ